MDKINIPFLIIIPLDMLSQIMVLFVLLKVPASFKRDVVLQCSDR